MIYIITDQTCEDDFGVNDPNSGLLIGGLIQTDFQVSIFDPDGLNRSDSTGGDLVYWAITEKYLNSGYYTIVFEPDKLGDWVVSIINATYFPWGKSQNYRVVESDFFSGDIASLSEELNNILVFILGLY